MRLDFQMKEYQAREVVSNIKDMTSYKAVTKALHEVRLVLINPNDIKSVAAYTLSKIKEVLPVYQQLGEAAPEQKKPDLNQQIAEARERLAFVEGEAPTTLFSDQEKAVRIAQIQAEIDALLQQQAAG